MKNMISGIVRAITLASLCFAVASAQAAVIVAEETPCHYEESKIIGYELTDHAKLLSYVTSDGSKIFLATATEGGVLSGRGVGFNAPPGTPKVFDTPWVGVAEIVVTDRKRFKYKVLDFKAIYVPLKHVLTVKDLGLNEDWEIFSFAYDYDLHKQTFDEKVWQFSVKNKKTGATNTVIASNIEKALLNRCKIDLKSHFLYGSDWGNAQ